MEMVFALIITVLTPAGMPDQHRVIPMHTLEECWQNAKTVVESDVPEGATGIAAACGKQAKKSQDHPA